MNKLIKQLLDKIADVRGILPLSGLFLVLVSLIAQFVPALSFLIVNDWLLHVGVLLGLGGLLVADAL